MKVWGASKTDWARVKKLVKRDALPVVSNPTLPISPRSHMRGVGKTPSILNSKRQIAGFTDWTQHQTTVPNIEAWMEEPDYGVCIQTRDVRALDIDIPNKALAKKVRLRFLELIGLPELPRRWRADSGKELLAFRVEGTGEELTRRSFIVKEWQDETTGKIKRWLVEFLATGQQFIAAGTHPDGERYVWDGDGMIPEEVPTITLEVFLAAWAQLCEEFKLEGTEERHRDRRAPTLVEGIDVSDPVIEHLVESDWPTYDYERGQLYVECPWADTHGSDNGPTQTSWMAAGTGGYRNGHFSCRHTGCDHHTDAEFLQAVGYRPIKAEEFEDLSGEPVERRELVTVGTSEDLAVLTASTLPDASAKAKEWAKALTLPNPGFDRDGRDHPMINLANLQRSLNAYQVCRCEIAFDTFKAELMISTSPGAWRPLVDADAVELRLTIERTAGMKASIGRELMRDALELVGSKTQFDSAVYWLKHVVPAWDGIARIHRFWPDYMQTKDTPYTRALGNYTWTAQAARILDPGCKVDMVPVLVGEEGTRKSTAISLIPPSEDHFAEFHLDKKDEDLARLMRGCLVGELSELRGISARDGEAILGWITRRFEKWTPKFKEYATSLARRLVFYGTTNDSEFLQAHMGQRRWLPVMILDIINTWLIERDRLQLWAEARDVYECEGILYQEVEKLAKAERAQFRYQDPRHDVIARWVDQSLDDDDTLTPRNSGTLTTEQVLTECLGVEASRIQKRDQQGVAEVLKALGMARIQRKMRGRNIKVWVDGQA
ncbi:MAG: hypothetical protein EPN98_14830 [Phenylobacterium sp.]|uniref:VapE domain-containing protein n=1 Tax=Phenylobacterium sp. TaxID=1871053 RepID=UPI0011FB364A|nr:VapE domain-containing protein [Phenylobacterium sp.]TAL32083.1 MAG: hypothetical protein EPN98_14830 [Phenylobacterium sp.]